MSRQPSERPRTRQGNPRGCGGWKRADRGRGTGMSPRPRLSFVLVITLAAHGLLACSGSDEPATAGDGAADGGTKDAAAGGDGPGGGVDAGTGLQGTVKDKAGVAVSGAQVEAGGAMVFSDTEGKYALAVPAGMVTVKVTRNWFKPLEESVTVAAGAATTHDITFSGLN